MIIIKEPTNVRKLCSLDFGVYFILAGDEEPSTVFMSMSTRIDSKSASYRYEYKVLKLGECGGEEQWMCENAEVIPVDIVKMYVKED